MPKNDENKLPKILVAEDTDDFRDLLKEYLVHQNMEVHTAANGKEAEALLAFTKFDLVISDIKMPEMNGVELLHRIKKDHPRLPVILMTGFSHILETEEAHSIGANDFISKPFNFKDLMNLVYKYVQSPEDKSVQQKAKSNISDNKANFFPIPIEDFLSGPVLKYDLYIKLGDSKFVKLADAGMQIDKERIETYKSKGVVMLFITLDDYKKYLQLNIQLTNSLSTDSKYKKVSSKIIGNINGMLNNLAFRKSIDDVTFNDTKEVCTKTFQLVSDNFALISMLESLKKISDAELFHATAVSFVASLISRKMAWTYSPNIHKLVLASVFHDLGKKSLPPSLVNKSIVIMSNAELKEYQKHVTTGRDILLEIKAMPSDVIQAIYEHHETFNGTGFPNGTKNQQIHPFARIIRIADDFCNYMYPKEGAQARSIEATLETMSTVKSQEYDPALLKGFMKAFNK